MVSNEAYICTETEFGSKQSELKYNDKSCNVSDNDYEEDRIYDYNEAIALTGNGCYNIGLLASLSLAILSMCVDIYSFSIIVALCSCEFKLQMTEQSILMSIPFLGPMVLAYGWGYISDTRGRKMSLTIGMTVSFVTSVLCAFAPNWITLAILKFVGTCFCSCALSVTFALLGESCAENVKGIYMICLAGIINLTLGFNFAISYAVITKLDFSFVIPGFITFVPWRLLTLILALPLGLTVLSLVFFYESPKFLLNSGRKDEALVVLKKICRRNGRNPEKYPVKKLVLTEDGNINCKDMSLLRSMWEQTYPLFKPPLLSRTLMLFYLIMVIYSTSNTFFVWLPFMSAAFSAGIRSNDKIDGGLCGILSLSTTSNTTSELKSCNSAVELPMVFFTSGIGIILCILNTLMSKLASRRKALTISLLLITSACCLGAIHIPNSIANIIIYFGTLLVDLIIGVLFSYCVDLYPTSFRGMASCLCVVLSRVSTIGGVNLIGPYIMIHDSCRVTIYSVAVLLLSGAIVAGFLPPDRPNKVT